MAFFDNLTSSLKQKWLEFFQSNRSWITLQMELESVYTPDGGRRPPSYLILGVVSALEPQLAQMMLPFSKLNPDPDALIEVLELNFDPDLVLGNRINPLMNPEGLNDTDIVITALTELTELDQDELSDMALDQTPDEVVLVATDDESVVVLSADEAAGLTDMSLDDLAAAMGVEESNQEPLEPLNATELDESGDVMSDVWNEGTSSEPEQANEKQDEEISRLFPNS